MSCSHLKVLPLENLLPNGTLNSRGCSKASGPHQVGPSTGLLTTQQLGSPRSKRKKRRAGSYSVLYNLILERTCDHFCCILLVTYPGTHPGTWDNYARMWIPGGKDHWGPSYRLATAKHIFLHLSFSFSLHSSSVFQVKIPPPFLLLEFFSLSSIQCINIRLIFLKHIFH